MNPPTPTASPAASAPLDAITPPAFAPYTPPAFATAVAATFIECLREQHREIEVNPANTWLVRHLVAPPSDPPPPALTVPLLTSLVEHFTGHWQWQDVASAGLYTTPTPEPDEPSIGALDSASLKTLYTEVSTRLADRYKQMLSDHWAQAQASGKSRRDDFIAERALLLRLEAQVRVEMGELDPGLYGMLSDTLDFGMDTSADPLQRHGVFSLSLGSGSDTLFALPGAFVITEQRASQRPAADDQALGQVLLYTPIDSLERFDSLKHLTEALTRRLAEPGPRQRLLGLLTHDDVTALATLGSGSPAPVVEWHLLKLGNNFMSLLLTGQILKQKADFDHAVAIAQSLVLNQASLDRLLLDLMATPRLFDNHRAGRQLDSALLREQLPPWWQTINDAQRTEWTGHATAFAEEIRNIRRLSQDYFKAPQADSAQVIKTYIDTTVDAALSSKGVTLSSTQIQVMATFRTTLPRPAFPLGGLETGTTSRTFSLHQLAHENPQVTRIHDASALLLADAHGRPIAGIDGNFVVGLLASLDVPQRLDDFLALHFNHSDYARQLRKHQRALLSARMKMGYLQAFGEGFAEDRLRWIAAVLASPEVNARHPVDAAPIEVRLLHINGMKIPDIMLIAPAGKFERGPLVLCTLNAPDNVLFRAFNSMFHLKQEFLESAEHRPYIAQLLPAAKSQLGMTMLAYNRTLKHWRLPDVFTALPTPIPIPAFVFNPVTFAAQTKDLLDEHFETKIQNLKDEARGRWLKTRDIADQTDTFDLVASIALLLLPTPFMIPLALGLSFCNAWSGFQKIDENDWEGAAQEFLDATTYLLAAGIGHLGAAAARSHPQALARRPHLVRRTGRNGQVQIGYLLSPARAPLFVESGMIVSMDSARFAEVTIGRETGYVSRRFNLFGRSRLYRQYDRNPAYLIHEDEFVVRNRNGGWSKVQQPLVRLPPQADRQARRELDQLIKDWPASTALEVTAEPSLDETRYLALARESNADSHPEILDYIEGGSQRINRLFRNNARTAETRRFLDQFYQLKSWTGNAYRSAHVTDEGLMRLREELGAVFTDSGVQSASTSRTNALRWSRDPFVTEQAEVGSHPVFFIFAPSVPKKNLFSSFLGDHVAVAPGMRIQLRALRQVNEQYFAYFTAPDRLVSETYDLFNGERELFVR